MSGYPGSYLFSCIEMSHPCVSLPRRERLGRDCVSFIFDSPVPSIVRDHGHWWISIYWRGLGTPSCFQTVIARHSLRPDSFRVPDGYSHLVISVHSGNGYRGLTCSDSQRYVLTATLKERVNRQLSQKLVVDGFWGRYLKSRHLHHRSFHLLLPLGSILGS